jgi:type VI secretion system Hcp family effector
MAGYMYISGVPGEVTQGSRAVFADPDGKKGALFYHKWIEVHSVTQTVTRAIETGRSGTARARAACVLEDIEIEKEVDASSMELIKAVSGGKAFDEVMIHLCSASEDNPDLDPGQSLHPYLELHLFSVKVTSYNINASGLDDGSIPVETLNLNFDKVYWRYWPMGPTPDKLDAKPNEVHDQIATGWDVIRATSVSPPPPGQK